jgi:hypothetical protein
LLSRRVMGVTPCHRNDDTGSGPAMGHRLQPDNPQGECRIRDEQNTREIMGNSTPAMEGAGNSGSNLFCGATDL